MNQTFDSFLMYYIDYATTGVQFSPFYSPPLQISPATTSTSLLVHVHVDLPTLQSVLITASVFINSYVITFYHYTSIINLYLELQNQRKNDFC